MTPTLELQTTRKRVVAENIEPKLRVSDDGLNAAERAAFAERHAATVALNDGGDVRSVMERVRQLRRARLA